MHFENPTLFCILYYSHTTCTTFAYFRTVITQNLLFRETLFEGFKILLTLYAIITAYMHICTFLTTYNIIYILIADRSFIFNSKIAFIEFIFLQYENDMFSIG